jgi:hypothetical protein
MNNKQAFLKPKAVFELLADDGYAWSGLRFFESLSYNSNFYKEKFKSISQVANNNELRYRLSITDRRDFDILVPTVPFDQSYSNDLVNDMILLLSFSGLQPDGTYSTRWVGKQYCFTKRPSMNRPN